MQPKCQTSSHINETALHTYSSELNASTHFELNSPAHDVDALVSTNDGLAVPFNVQVTCCTAGDLKIRDKNMRSVNAYRLNVNANDGQNSPNCAGLFKTIINTPKHK